MLKDTHIAQIVYNTPWAILPEKLAAILKVVDFRLAGGRLTPEEIEALSQARVQPAPRSAGSVAVLPLLGLISHRANMLGNFSGGTSIEKFTAAFRQAIGDPGVKAVVLDVDSPGGTVDGVEELSAEIFAARASKPIYAVANTLGASAAYWIASSASELIVTPSGEVGSIGVYAAHQDFSEFDKHVGVKTTLISAGKFKTEGNEFEPLADAARAALQSRVDEYYSMFVKAVGRNRGVPQADVRKGFGEGRVVGAKQAVTLGMADRIATLDETLARLGVSFSGRAIAALAPVVPSLDLKRRQLETL